MSNDQKGTTPQEELIELVKSVKHEFTPRGIESLEQTLTVEIKESPTLWGFRLPDTIADNFLFAVDEFESSDFEDQRTYRDTLIPLIVEARQLQHFTLSQQIEKLRRISQKITEDKDFANQKPDFSKKFGVFYIKLGDNLGKRSFIVSDEARQQAIDLLQNLREEVDALEIAYQQKLGERMLAEHEKYQKIRQKAASDIRRTVAQARAQTNVEASVTESGV